MLLLLDLDLQWSDFLFFFFLAFLYVLNKSPANSSVEENAAKLFYLEASEIFCGLPKLPCLSIIFLF